MWDKGRQKVFDSERKPVGFDVHKSILHVVYLLAVSLSETGHAKGQSVPETGDVMVSFEGRIFLFVAHRWDPARQELTFLVPR